MHTEDVIKIGIVMAPYHPSVRSMKLHVDTLIASSTFSTLVAVREVAGCFEVPLAVKRMLKGGIVDGVVVLGAIEKGETGHGIALARAIFPALINLALEFEKPVGLGIIGPHATLEQIEVRAKHVAESAIQAVLQDLANI